MTRFSRPPTSLWRPVCWQLTRAIASPLARSLTQPTPSDFSTGSQGGARPIGTGVYLVSTGSAKIGLEALDLDGGKTLYEWEASIYDPYTTVSA